MDAIEELIAAATDMITLGRAGIEDASARLLAHRRELTIRDKVATALALKMLSSFEALLADVKEERSESMHHLKTLCETFIYLHEAAVDDDRAELVLALAHAERIKFWESNPGIVAPERIVELKVKMESLSRSRPLPANLRQVAGRHLNLPRWYDHVYRLACEPAHVSDLEDFFPNEEGRLSVGATSASAGRAYIALHYGIHLMLALAAFVNDSNDIGLEIDIKPIETRVKAAVRR